MTKLEDYASEPGKSAMDLVLFRCAILPTHLSILMWSKVIAMRICGFSCSLSCSELFKLVI